MQDKENGVNLEERKKLREELAEKCAESHIGTVEEKQYQDYAFFCDDPEEETGFKPARVAQYLADPKIERFKTDRKTGILYYGDSAKGVWDRDGESKLREIVSKILGENDKKIHYTNILHTLKSVTQCDIVFSEKISVGNGLLDLETLDLKPFTLEEMAFYQIETEYNKDADCPQFKEFLSQVLAPEDIPTLQEWSGYLLLPDYRYHKLLWVHGEGRNGKGSWQRSMESILGESNVSSLGLEEFDGNHRFAMERLYGKLFNVCSEPTTNRVLQTALLKKATGQDLISGEIKGKQKRVEFRNCAKVTVIANKFPKVKDTTIAFKERRLFIKFPNEFTGANCIANIERNWLEDPIERMGILNWMLEGLQRLLTNGCFTESKTQEETEIAFERASDSITAFLREMVVKGKNFVTPRSVLYNAYKDYCENFGLDIENDKKFTQRLKEEKGVTTGRVKNERAWKGISHRSINEDGEITRTDSTDGTLAVYSHVSENVDIKESEERVQSVQSVPVKNCGQCANFRMPSCDAKDWENRNGNLAPLTNWCFKPITELEE